MLFAIISWHANSDPLSVVIDFSLPLNGASKCMILIYLKLQFYVELANPRHFVITACGRKFTA